MILQSVRCAHSTPDCATQTTIAFINLHCMRFIVSNASRAHICDFFQEIDASIILFILFFFLMSTNTYIVSFQCIYTIMIIFTCMIHAQLCICISLFNVAHDDDDCVYLRICVTWNEHTAERIVCHFYFSCLRQNMNWLIFVPYWVCCVSNWWCKLMQYAIRDRISISVTFSCIEIEREKKKCCAFA